jgi:hypothetical protein
MVYAISDLRREADVHYALLGYHEENGGNFGI